MNIFIAESCPGTPDPYFLIINCGILASKLFQLPWQLRFVSLWSAVGREPAEACWVCQSVVGFAPSCEMCGGNREAARRVGEVAGRLHRAMPPPGWLGAMAALISDPLLSLTGSVFGSPGHGALRGALLLPAQQGMATTVRTRRSQSGERQEDHHQERAWRLCSQA